MPLASFEEKPSRLGLEIFGRVLKDSPWNLGNELLLEATKSHLSGPCKQLRSNSNVDAVICWKCSSDHCAKWCYTWQEWRSRGSSVKGFASLRAQCLHLGNCSTEACPVRSCDKRVSITVLLLLRRSKEGAGLFGIQTYLCHLTQRFSNDCQCNFELFLFHVHVFHPELLLGPSWLHLTSQSSSVPSG